MTQLPVSVVVVSRGRPDALQRALTGISQLVYPNFEVIVVADAAGLDAVDGLDFGDQIKTVACEEANISRARNLGITAAAGEVVAFIDDDAVPEPGWLFHLTAPFEDDAVMAAGGWVRGRNGISIQWAAQTVDRTAQATALDLASNRPVVLWPEGGRAIKTEGTNMAVRRDVLAEIGGFDPAYRYYLDETDLNLRMAAHGYATALVPLAEVHHGYFENAQRTASRVPRDLHEIGASMAFFLRKFCEETEARVVWRQFRSQQRLRLLHYMVRGDAMPGDVGRLMRGLDRGYAAGMKRSAGVLEPLVRPAQGFRKFETRSAGPVVLAGRFLRRRAVRQQAQELVAEGKVPSVFLFSRTALYHRVMYRSAGYWEQVGGLFGRSERQQKPFRLIGFGKRLRIEKKRVAAQRMLLEEGATKPASKTKKGMS